MGQASWSNKTTLNSDRNIKRTINRNLRAIKNLDDYTLDEMMAEEFLPETVLESPKPRGARKIYH